jgi:hypothetical protein
LALFTLARGITKSDLLKVLIEDWMASQKLKDSDKEMLEELVIRIKNEWRAHRTKHPRASFNEFKTSLETELTDKGLDEKYVKSVIHQIKEY